MQRFRSEIVNELGLGLCGGGGETSSLDLSSMGISRATDAKAWLACASA